MRLLDVVKIKPPLPAVADSLREGEDLLINAVSPPPADASTCQKRKKCAHSIFLFYFFISRPGGGTQPSVTVCVQTGA